MKKLSKFFAIIISFVFFGVFSFISIPSKSVSATTNTEPTTAEFYNTVNSVLEKYVQFRDRIPGSQNEKDASNFIVEFLNNNTECAPLNNSYVKDGVQSFRFESILDGQYYTSQNIIYTHKSTSNSDKKIIIGCSYDAIAFKFGTFQMEGELVSSESVNGSAGSVALLLALAKYLSIQSFDYDIEFIFFGAGESDNAGSTFYTQGISKDDAKNIALMINLDKVALGENTYFYVDEIENSFSKYFNNLSHEKKLGIKKVSTANLGKVLNYRNKLGLDYTHIALTSNNINFMSSNILSLNVFAGDYSDGITLGLCEYGDRDILTYTDYDSIEYIIEVYGINEVTDNLYTAFNSINTLLNDSNFLINCLESANQPVVFINFLETKNLWLILLLL